MLLQSQINKKKITFNNKLYIVLIPDRNAYNYELKKILWFNESELNLIRTNALLELNNILLRHPLMDINQAKKLLYQPNNITFDEKNFL